MRRVTSAPRPDLAPPPDWASYEEFARQALSLLSAGDHPDCRSLREQLRCAKLAEIDYTGAGFFVSIETPADVQPLDRSGVIGDVHAEAADNDAPLGVLLFIKNGCVDALEVFAYSDWPKDLRQFKFSYVAWDRHAEGSGSTARSVEHRDFASMWDR